MGDFWKLITKAFRPITQARRALLTVLNPFFSVPNFSRDIQDAFANVSIEREKYDMKGIRRSILKNMAPAASAIAKNYFGNAESGSRMVDYLMEASAAGMKMSWANYGQMQEQLESLQKMADKMKDGYTRS